MSLILRYDETLRPVFFAQESTFTLDHLDKRVRGSEREREKDRDDKKIIYIKLKLSYFSGSSKTNR